jgi:hypothetical protein
MEKSQQHRPHLFVLHIWLEDLGDGTTEWRGDIECAESREKRYFREWTVLFEFVMAQLQSARAQEFSVRREKTTFSE